MTSRRRFACLFSVAVFVALRALAHAYPAPLPWTSGVFDGEGLDDILQTVRIAYTKSDDIRHIARELLSTPTGRVSPPAPSVAGETILNSAHSRAPPTC